MEIDFEAKLREAVLQLEKHGVEYAHAKALSWQMQEMRKVVKASEMQKITDGTMVERENMARVSSVYVEHIEGTASAIEKEHSAKARYERWFAQMECLRSLCSRETAKIKAIGGTDADSGGG